MSFYLAAVNGRTMRGSDCLDTEVSSMPLAGRALSVRLKYPDQLLSLMMKRSIDLGIFLRKITNGGACHDDIGHYGKYIRLGNDEACM